MDKRSVVDAVVESLEADLVQLRAAAQQTRKGAIHEESRSENDKDTRGLEASYLARGQALRVEQTVESLAKIRFMQLASFDEQTPLNLSALVTVQSDEEIKHFFLAGSAGGVKVKVDGTTVQLITPASPMGRMLISKRVGDEFSLNIDGKSREYEILAVC